jgi:hypothetical protein
MPPYSGYLAGRQRRVGKKSYLRQPVIMGVTLDGEKLLASSLRMMDDTPVLVCVKAPRLAATVTIVMHDARGQMVIAAGCVIDRLPTTDGRAAVACIRIDCARTKGSRLYFRETLASCLGLRISESDLLSEGGLWGFQRPDGSHSALNLDELAKQRTKKSAPFVLPNVRVNHRVAVCHQERFKPGIAVDISLDGMRLGLQEPLAVGSELLVYYPVSVHAGTDKLIATTRIEQVVPSDRKAGVFAHVLRIESFATEAQASVWADYHDAESRIGGSGRLQVKTGLTKTRGQRPTGTFRSA